MARVSKKDREMAELAMADALFGDPDFRPDDGEDTFYQTWNALVKHCATAIAKARRSLPQPSNG